jgi:hypothetical protein
MRDLFRYLLVLSVVGLGFYGASQYRVTDELSGTMDELAELEIPPAPPDPVGSPGKPTQASPPTEVIPLAALLDADRSSPNEPQRELPANLKRVPRIARQSVPSPTAFESDPPRPSDPPRNGLMSPPEERGPAKFPLPKLAVRPGNRFAVPDPTENDFVQPKADERFDSPWDDPEPVDPEPVDPEPVAPEPVAPEPVAPEPVDPEPVDPEPVDPEPVDPESGQQVTLDGSQSDPIPLAHSQLHEQSLATKPSRSTLIHHVEAGDTLPKLAERYLGDREKYKAIFEANAKILPDPRLLPIGVDLEIPVLATTEVATDHAADVLLDDPQHDAPRHDDPLDDLFAPPGSPERTSRHLEPIPPQALPNPPLDAWRPSLR